MELLLSSQSAYNMHVPKEPFLYKGSLVISICFCSIEVKEMMEKAKTTTSNNPIVVLAILALLFLCRQECDSIFTRRELEQGSNYYY